MPDGRLNFDVFLFPEESAEFPEFPFVFGNIVEPIGSKTASCDKLEHHG